MWIQQSGLPQLETWKNFVRRFSYIFCFICCKNGVIWLSSLKLSKPSEKSKEYIRRVLEEGIKTKANEEQIRNTIMGGSFHLYNQV